MGMSNRPRGFPGMPKPGGQGMFPPMRDPGAQRFPRAPQGGMVGSLGNWGAGGAGGGVQGQPQAMPAQIPSPVGGYTQGGQNFQNNGQPVQQYSPPSSTQPAGDYGIFGQDDPNMMSSEELFRRMFAQRP